MKHLASFTMAALIAASSPGTIAQVPAGLEGEWRGRILVPGTGRQFDAQLHLKAGDGTWRAVVSSSGDPCVGIAMPVSWSLLDAESLEVSFLGSKALTGCRDSTVHFERVDGSTFKGRTPSGLEIVLTRR